MATKKIKLVTDNSHRAVQARELARALGKYGLKREVQISVGIDVIDAALENKSAFKVHIGDPQTRHAGFDLIVTPGYEPHIKAPNVIETIGLINHISPEYLAGKERDFGIGGNITAVLVGGRHIGGNFSVDDAHLLAAILNDANYPVLATTSKRTEVASAKALREAIKVPCIFYDFAKDGQDANPYEAMLASATRIFVTADSVRMMSEAASSGREVFIYTPEETHFSYMELRDEILAAKRPLRESGRVAEIIFKILAGS